MTSALSIAAAVPVAYALANLYGTLRCIGSVHTFPRDARAGAKPPRLSLIVPACNEASGIEAALRSKLACEYADLEIVVVDDRSTDGTSAIVDRLAAEDPRIRAVHVTALPAGWLGKVHALARGAEAATGDLLLFSDADVHFSATVLERAVATLEREDLDFVTVIPHLMSTSLALDAVMTAFLRVLIVSGRVWRVRDPNAPHAVGAGVFNLVRRRAFDASPGFEWLRMEVADDVAFGQMMKKAGARCAVYNGKGDVWLEFYGSLGEFLRGIEKNAYAVTGFQVPLALLGNSLFALFEVVPFFVLFFATGPVFMLALASTSVLLASQVAAARWAGRPLASACIPAFGTAVVVFASLRSMVLTESQRGVRWRGTFYPLEELREHARLERHR